MSREDRSALSDAVLHARWLQECRAGLEPHVRPAGAAPLQPPPVQPAALCPGCVLPVRQDEVHVYLNAEPAHLDCALTLALAMP